MSGRSEERLIGGRSGRILFALSLGTVALFAGQLTISPMLPTIVDDFGITSTTAGTAITIMWASAAVAMYPGGRYSDQLSRRTILVASLSLAALGVAVVSAAPTFLVFAVALAVVGIGVGLFEPTCMATVSDYFVAYRGRAMGVISASYNIGSGAAAGLAALSLWLGNWRIAFVPTAVLLALLVLMVHRWSTDPYDVSKVSLRPVVAIKRVILDTRLRILLAVFCLHMFIWQSTLSFYPTLLQREFGFSANAATVAFATIFAIGLVATPIVGALGDRFGNRRIGLIAPTAGAAGLTMILAVPRSVSIAVGTVAFAVGLVSFWPVMNAKLMNEFSSDTLGADYGIARAVFFGVGSFGPMYVGVVADASSFVVAYAGLVISFLLIVIGLLWLGRLE